MLFLDATLRKLLSTQEHPEQLQPGQIASVEETETLEHCCWGCKMVQLLWMDTVQWLLKKSKKELSYDQQSHLWVYTQKAESKDLKRYLYTLVHSSTVPTAKMWKQPKSPLVDEWISQMWHMHMWNVIQP